MRKAEVARMLEGFAERHRERSDKRERYYTAYKIAQLKKKKRLALIRKMRAA